MSIISKTLYIYTVELLAPNAEIRHSTAEQKNASPEYAEIGYTSRVLAKKEERVYLRTSTVQSLCLQMSQSRSWHISFS